MTIEEECQLAAARAQEANEAGTYDTRCIAGELVFYAPHTHGIMPGHIYSELGVDEFHISKSCEYHFDLWTAEPEEDDEDASDLY